MTRKTARQFNCHIELVLEQECGKCVMRYIFNDRSPRNLPEVPPGDSPEEVTTNTLNLMGQLVKDHLAQWMFKAYEDLTGTSKLVKE